MVGGRLPAFPPGKVSDRRRYWSKQHSSTGKVTQRKKTPWQQTEKKWIKVRKKAKLDDILEESEDNLSESELSSHADLDPEYNPMHSSSLSRDKKISRDTKKR
ncbi:Siroheme synthase 2, partial [Clarias magur]